MKIKRITLGCVTVLAMIAIPIYLTRAQSSGVASRAESLAQELDTQFSGAGWLDKVKELESEALEGSWELTITPVVPPGVPQPASFGAVGSFVRGGAVISSDRRRPASRQYGTWVHLGGTQFAFSGIEDLYDSVGNPAGTARFRVTLNVTGKDQFVGVSNGEQRNAAGNVVFSGCGTVRGERIKLEPLSAQCQSIIPPQ
jgi:hypothetical protein